MARSQTDLPRMQNQSRATLPLERGLKVASQRIEKPVQSGKLPPRMMRQYDLIERVKRYNPATSEALLNRAYVYAMKAHGQQKRASGDLYFSHPLAKYFNVGRIGRDQIESYAGRRGVAVSEVEKWLGPNLAYESSEFAKTC